MSQTPVREPERPHHHHARTHDLPAARVVIQGDFTDECQEEVLVQQIADSWHRIGRCREIEASTIDLDTIQFFCQHHFDEKPAAHNPHNERLALGYAFEHKGDQLCRLRRYETAIERSYYRAVQQLARMQTLRMKQEKLIGSVSQNQGAPPVEPLARTAGSPALRLKPGGKTSAQTDQRFHCATVYSSCRLRDAGIAAHPPKRHCLYRVTAK